MGALAWVRLARLSRDMIRREEQQLRPDRVTVAELDLIAQIGVHEGLTQQELAAALLVSQGNVTYQVDKLGRCGLVERRVAGKCNHLYLTDHGRLLFARLVPRQEERHARDFDVLTDGEQRALLSILRKLRRLYR